MMRKHNVWFQTMNVPIRVIPSPQLDDPLKSLKCNMNIPSSSHFSFKTCMYLHAKMFKG